MRSGRLQPIERTAGDELIAGTERDPTLLSDLPDSDPALAAAAADEGERGGVQTGSGLRLRFSFRVRFGVGRAGRRARLSAHARPSSAPRLRSA